MHPRRIIRWILPIAMVASFLREQARTFSCDLSSSRDAPAIATIAPRHWTDGKDGKPTCGVLYFFHIPSTGGAAINKWLLRQEKQYNYKYFTMWGIQVDKAGRFHKNPEKIEESFIGGMRKHVTDLGSNEWRIAHSHILSSYLNESDLEMDYWRARVESQGCKMVNTITFRDPLSHAMSLYKVHADKNATREEWIEHLRTPSAAGKWATQLDFLLYDNCARRNPYGVSKEEKVRRGLEILDRHFDVIAVSDHNFYFDETLRQTGWNYKTKILKSNVHQGEISFTKKEVETLQKLLDQNGDTDFYNAVKMRYKGHLSYLH